MSNSIFIHFLNRELFRSINIERITGVNDALKILLLAKDSNIYAPLSSIWENENSTDLDYGFFDMIYDSGQIELISECATIDEFLDRNSKMYFYDKERYNCYFLDSYMYGKYKPMILKNHGSTKNIKNTLKEWKITEKLPLYLPKRDIEIFEFNKHKIIEISQQSEGKGITRSLFQGKLDNNVYELSISRLLSTCYINDYLDCFNGDIATGVNAYISYYDALAKCFPYNDVPILKAILECAGIEKFAFTNDKNDEWFSFLYMRCNPQHERICGYISEIIKSCLNNYEKYNNKSISTRIISNELIVYIKRVASLCNSKIIRIFSVNQLDILEKNLKVILDYFYDNTEYKNKSIISKGEKTMKTNNKVFIVHGHNELLKEQVANWLYSLNLEPIILHKKPTGGTISIIDKIEKYSDVCCAIVLLTADDVGKAKDEKRYKKRSRQNVVFEAGYFIGKIGSSNVILLHEKNVELPGDLGGCVYIMADDQGGWKEQMRIEFDELKIDYKK